MSTLPSVALPQIIREQARARPTSPALRTRDSTWTYEALSEVVGARSAALRALELQPGAGVAVMAERSATTVISILAVVDAGLAWIPVNPDMPAARRDFVLADSGAGALIEPGSEFALRRLTDVEGPLAETAAYVIYTSGTTGEPKGVEISRGSLESLLEWSTSEFAYRPDDVFSMVHSPAFDYSIWEMWNAFASGACLVVADDHVVHDPHRLLDFLRTQQVSVLHLVPSVLRRLVDAERGTGSGLPDCRLLVTGGEAFDLEATRTWCRRVPGEPPQVVNMYGPTECTIVATFERIDVLATTEARWTSIGNILPDTTARITDPSGADVHQGESGELWISSARIATGYVGRPALTAERFVLDGNGARSYRTGDVVRRREDGCLEFVGRDDDQVKIAGHRVEIGEVEQAVRSLDGIADCAVGVFTDARSAQRLGAVVVLDDAVDMTGREIRARLVDRIALPVVPVRIVLVPTLPLSASSKVDRRAISRLLASDNPTLEEKTRG
ncbi:amino acid adenylation domain-containing protein [Curtobacterium sp. 9128]|uniref:amino acid adenylation domain-containing protein n=1 Tax=Curtobacterium sp. 9128 TaxID=1793722 RepID=UPI0011A89C1B|nr:amino acid adenylation domain-containing protein [Curtobacterium sp. 9128]